MIRAGKAIDLPELAVMLRAMHARSKYAAHTDINQKALDQTLLGLIAAQNQGGPGGTMVAVAVEEGEIVGFVAGILQRVYFIGDKLEANDAFLVVKPGQHQRCASGLIDAYVEWARANPKVIDIKLSWTDTLPHAERVAAMYRRKRFQRVGEIYELRGARECQA